MKQFTAGAVAALCLCSFLSFAAAAERSARLTIDLKISGTETMRNGSDHATTRIAQRVQLATTVRSNGELDSVNVKAPDFAHKMQAQADAQERRTREVQQMQQQNAQRQRAQGATPPAMTPASQADMMAMAQQLQARCGDDQQCLMNEAMKFSAQQVAGNDPALRQRLEAHGAERARCEREFASDAKRRAACLDAAEVRAGGTGGDNLEPEEDRRYLAFFGFDGCGATVSATIDDQTSGRYGDVQGMVPYTVTRKADWRADACRRASSAAPTTRPRRQGAQHQHRRPGAAGSPRPLHARRQRSHPQR